AGRRVLPLLPLAELDEPVERLYDHRSPPFLEPRLRVESVNELVPHRQVLVPPALDCLRFEHRQADVLTDQPHQLEVAHQSKTIRLVWLHPMLAGHRVLDLLDHLIDQFVYVVERLVVGEIAGTPDAHPIAPRDLTKNIPGVGRRAWNRTLVAEPPGLRNR